MRHQGRLLKHTACRDALMAQTRYRIAGKRASARELSGRRWKVTKRVHQGTGSGNRGRGERTRGAWGSAFISFLVAGTKSLAKVT